MAQACAGSVVDGVPTWGASGSPCEIVGYYLWAGDTINVSGQVVVTPVPAP